MNRRVVIGMLLLLVPVAAETWGDIYRHENRDGVVSFTDTPANGSYTMYLREKRQTLRGATSRKPTLSPSVSGTPEALSLPIQGRVTSPTGFRHDPFDGKLRHHNGIDIAAPTGTPVKPVAPGIVIFSGQRNGYGNTVIVDHQDGMQTIYAHHSANLVAEGTQVDRSTVIALSGSTGRSTGPHLHFEAWRDGSNVTPSFMPGSDVSPAIAARARDSVNRILQPDGTILFTNLR